MYVHKGAAEFLYRKMTVATYLGGGEGLLGIIFVISGRRSLHTPWLRFGTTRGSLTI